MERRVPKGSPLPAQTHFPGYFPCLYEPTGQQGRTRSPAPHRALRLCLPLVTGTYLCPTGQTRITISPPSPHLQEPLDTCPHPGLPATLGLANPFLMSLMSRSSLSPTSQGSPSDLHENPDSFPCSQGPVGSDLPDLGPSPSCRPHWSPCSEASPSCPCPWRSPPSPEPPSPSSAHPSCLTAQASATISSERLLASWLIRSDHPAPVSFCPQDSAADVRGQIILCCGGLSCTL